MANISTYPIGTPSAEDLIPGTQKFTAANGKKENLTRNFSVSDLNSLATNNYLETTKTITNAQWIALPGTDVELIASPGANKYIKVLALSVFFDYAAPDFAFAEPLNIGFGGNPIVAPQGIVSAPDEGNFGVDRVYSVPSPSNFGILLTNQALKIGKLTGAVTGGGKLKVKIRYQVLNTLAF